MPPDDSTAREAPQEGGRGRFLAQTVWMIAALSAASVLNVAFVALLARKLDSRDLAVFFCSWSVLLLAAAPGGAVQTYLAGLFAGRPDGGRDLILLWSRRLAIAGAATAGLFAALSPLLAPLLRFPSELPVVAAGLAVSAYAPLPLLYGRLQGTQRFGRLGAAYLVEAGTRPLAAAGLAGAGFLGATTSIVAMASGYLASGLLAFPARALLRPPPPSPAAAPESGGAPPGAAPPPPAISFPSTAVSMLALSAFAYMDVLFDQHYLGEGAGKGGSLLGGSGDYGAASYVGRAFVMLTLPLVSVMIPKVAAATRRGASGWPYLRDAAGMALAPLLLGGAVCVLAAGPVAGALFPANPGAAPLIRLFPAAILPYVLLAILTPYNLARGRRGTAAILALGVAAQWAGFSLFHGSHFEILAVLGASGAAAAAAVTAYTVVRERA
ncbi:MAG: hypothetical protein MUC63_00760 [Planctomycetes bacterium]|jgi:hypothetical protein|nr:hypothetical protein [Planctomycetota bacterium]